jgi:hypothetical protein
VQPDPLAARRVAAQIKKRNRVPLPTLKYWNYGPCEHHEEATPSCEYRACGGDFFDHQTVTISWLYFNQKGLVASVPGSGKTNVALGLTCLLKERGELPGRAIFIVQTPVTLQWLGELRRLTSLKAEAIYSGMSRDKRVEIYSGSWDVLIIGFHMLIKDVDLLEKFTPSLVITDDVDPLLNAENATHKAIVAVADRAKRVAVMNASSIQVRLSQIHAAMAPIGSKQIWGSQDAFEQRYIIREKFSGPKVKTKKGKVINTVEFREVGYKNWTDFKKRLDPWYIRFGYEDLTDIRMPQVMPPENVFLEMSPRQRKKYEELRKGVLRVVKEQGESIKHTNALTMIMYGQMVCAGLPALGEADGPGASVKLDWVMNQLLNAWSDQKIVVYIKNPGLIKAFQARLDSAGIGYGTVWGLESDPVARAADQKRFWEDPNCRVFIGTSAMERGLNLHCSNIVVCLDMLLNPSRMEQIVGRARRAGSPHEKIFTFNLFCTDSQEMHYLSVLQKRAAMINQVWDSESELFEPLSPLELLEMFKP